MTQASDNLANINAFKGKCDYLQSELSALSNELKEAIAQYAENEESNKAVELALSDVKYTGSYADGVRQLIKELEGAIVKYDRSNTENESYQVQIVDLEAERDSLAAQIKEAGEQEPVASTNKEQLGYLLDERYCNAPMAMWNAKYSAMPIKLYAHPPIREGWVMVPLSVLENATSSLSAFCSDEGWVQDYMDNIDAVNAKLAKYYARLSAVKKD